MTGSKLLITGATGFIGSRLCEKLKLQYRLPYRALVRNFTKAPRIARLGSDMAGGTLSDLASIEAALAGCDRVVHLAYGGENPTADTRNLLSACLRAKVKRFIHVSSMAVHGPKPGPECAREETATIGHYNSTYSDSKAAAEKLVQRAIDRDALPAVILRPTVVYGPHSPFVTRVVEGARRGRISLLDEGRGICNAVYVDDVCDAVVAALNSERALGRALFINADRAVSWREFNLAFAGMVDFPFSVDSVSAADATAYWDSQRPTFRRNLQAVQRMLVSPELQDQLFTVPAFRTAIISLKKFLKKVLPADQVIAVKALTSRASGPSREAVLWPDLGRITREDFHLEFSNELAKQLLEWKPFYDFPKGAALTRTWLEFADMLQRVP